MTSQLGNGNVHQSPDIDKWEGNHAKDNARVHNGHVFNSAPDPGYHKLSTLDQYKKGKEILRAARGDRATLRHLLESTEVLGAPPTITKYRSDWSAKTALHYAAGNGWKEEVESLAKARWNVDAVSTSRKTAVYRAALSGHPEVVTLLLEGKNGLGTKANLHVTGAKSPFVAAVEGGSQGCLEAMLDDWRRLDPGAKAQTYLGMAAAVCLATLKANAERKINVGGLIEILSSKEAQTAPTHSEQKKLLTRSLFYAAQRGDMAVFVLLLESKADINTTRLCFKGANKHSVLHEAAEHGHLNIVQQLVQNESLDPLLLRDLGGKTVLDVTQADAELHSIRDLVAERCYDEHQRSMVRRTRDSCLAAMLMTRRRSGRRTSKQLLDQGYVFYFPKKFCDWEVVSDNFTQVMKPLCLTIGAAVGAVGLAVLFDHLKNQERRPIAKESRNDEKRTPILL